MIQGGEACGSFGCLVVSTIAVSRTAFVSYGSAVMALCRGTAQRESLAPGWALLGIAAGSWNGGREHRRKQRGRDGGDLAAPTAVNFFLRDVLGKEILFNVFWASFSQDFINRIVAVGLRHTDGIT